MNYRQLPKPYIRVRKEKLSKRTKNDFYLLQKSFFVHLLNFSRGFLKKIAMLLDRLNLNPLERMLYPLITQRFCVARENCHPIKMDDLTK